MRNLTGRLFGGAALQPPWRGVGRALPCRDNDLQRLSELRCRPVRWEEKSPRRFPGLFLKGWPRPTHGRHSPRFPERCPCTEAQVQGAGARRCIGRSARQPGYSRRSGLRRTSPFRPGGFLASRTTRRQAARHVVRKKWNSAFASESVTRRRRWSCRSLSAQRSMRGALAGASSAARGGHRRRRRHDDRRATLNEIASVLKEASASRVVNWVVARRSDVSPVVLLHPEIRRTPAGVIRLAANTGARLHLDPSRFTSPWTTVSCTAPGSTAAIEPREVHKDWPSCKARLGERRLFALRHWLARLRVGRVSASATRSCSSPKRGLPRSLLGSSTRLRAAASADARRKRPGLSLERRGGRGVRRHDAQIGFLGSA